jgi:hypothetical protein
VANIAYRVGRPFSLNQAREIELPRWQELLAEVNSHVQAHGLELNSEAIAFSPPLEIDDEAHHFTGALAEDANRFWKREYRTGYEVPHLSEK